MGESIWSGKKTVRDVDDFEIKISKVKQLPSLTAVEILDLLNVCQVLVVCKDLDAEGRPMEMVSPEFQHMNDGKEFLIVDVIVPLC